MRRWLSSSTVFWLMGLPMTALLFVILVAGSRLLIHPTAVEVSPCGQVIVHRTYPMAETLGVRQPWVRYVQTVTPLNPETNGGYVCREDNALGHRYIHDHGRGFGSWTINHFAQACMDDPNGWHYEATWTALLFDLIPLRPVAITTKVMVAGMCENGMP